MENSHSGTHLRSNLNEQVEKESRAEPNWTLRGDLAPEAPGKDVYTTRGATSIASSFFHHIYNISLKKNETFVF